MSPEQGPGPKPPMNPSVVRTPEKRSRWRITKELASDFATLHKMIEQRELLGNLLAQKDAMGRAQTMQYKRSKQELDGRIYVGVLLFRSRLLASMKAIPGHSSHLPRHILSLTEERFIQTIKDKRTEKSRPPRNALETLLDRVGIRKEIATVNNVPERSVSFDMDAGTEEALSASFNVFDTPDALKRSKLSQELTRDFIGKVDKHDWVIDPTLADPLNALYVRYKKYGARAKISDNAIERVRTAVGSLIHELPTSVERGADQQKLITLVKRKITRNFFEKVFSTWNKKPAVTVAPPTGPRTPYEQGTIDALTDTDLATFMSVVLEQELLSKDEAQKASIPEDATSLVTICRYASNDFIHALVSLGLTQEVPEFEKTEREQEIESLQRTAMYKFVARLKDLYKDAGNIANPDAPQGDEASYLRVLGELLSERFGWREADPRAIQNPQKKKMARAAKRTAATDTQLSDAFTSMVRAGVITVLKDGSPANVEDLRPTDNWDFELHQDVLKNHAAVFIARGKLPGNVTNIFNEFSRMLHVKNAEEYRAQFTKGLKQVHEDATKMQEDMAKVAFEQDMVRTYAPEKRRLHHIALILSDGIRSTEEQAQMYDLTVPGFMSVRNNLDNTKEGLAALATRIRIDPDAVQAIKNSPLSKGGEAIPSFTQTLGALNEMLLSGKGWDPKLVDDYRRLMKNVDVARVEVEDITARLLEAPHAESHSSFVRGLLSESSYLLHELKRITQEAQLATEGFMEITPSGDVTVAEQSKINRQLERQQRAVALNAPDMSMEARAMAKALEKRDDELSRIMSAVGRDAAFMRERLEREKRDKLREAAARNAALAPTAVAESKDADIADAKAQLAASTAAVARLEDEKQQVSNEHEQTKAALKAAEDKLKDMEAQSKMNADAITRDLETKLADVQSKLESAKSEAVHMTAENAELKQRIEEISAKLDIILNGFFDSLEQLQGAYEKGDPLRIKAIGEENSKRIGGEISHALEELTKLLNNKS